MKNLIIITLSVCLTSCRPMIPEQARQAEAAATIIPDYSGITIPPNIAPLCFAVSGAYDGFVTQAIAADGQTATVRGREFHISDKEWKRLLTASVGGELRFRVYARSNGEWLQFPDIVNYVAIEPIDPYLNYRLIEPLYESWGQMGLYQRSLESFNEHELIHNRLIRSQCLNCHTFQNYRTERWLFHIRGHEGRTVVVNNGKLFNIQTKISNNYAAAVYPAWHPTLPLVAFSTNVTGQVFHSADKNLVEVVDYRSDLLLFDVEKVSIKNITLTDSLFETFPTWSPDGCRLYYCKAKSPVKRNDYQNPERKVAVADSSAYIHYDIFSRPFDSARQMFGDEDTVFCASRLNLSATFPRISPDGRWLLMTVGNYGNFHIWHRESDLYLMDLMSGNVRPLNELNSDETESFHDWSSNGRWIVVSSRRGDGAFTRPWFAYFDSTGVAHKPFILPQNNSMYYLDLMKSYNIPEFTIEKVKEKPRRLAKM